METEKWRRFWGIQEALKDALKNQEFQVWYQPQVHMGTGEIAGAEALVRWQKPGQGLLLPRTFIPELEEYGLMPRLDQEVLRIVCRDLAEAEGEGVGFGPVSVNLTRLHAGRYGRISGLPRTCRKGKDPGRELLFELTETAKDRDSGRQLQEFARQLREHGFRIAMDDYGIGSSTLKILHQISFDILKLDRYFVSRIGEAKAERILGSTISMAGELGMEVVAEGVETEEQAAFLLEKGCRLAQGYYYSEPLSRQKYLSFRREGKKLAPKKEETDREPES